METKTQSDIEKTVASAGRFDRKNTSQLPTYLEDTEAGLQVALSNMEVADGNIGMEEAAAFHYKVENLSQGLYNVGVPTNSITNAEGLNDAIRTPYSAEGNQSAYFHYHDERLTAKALKGEPSKDLLDLNSIEPGINSFSK